MKTKIIVVISLLLSVVLLSCTLASCYDLDSLLSSNSSSTSKVPSSTEASTFDTVKDDTVEDDNTLVSEYDPEAEFQLGDDNIYMSYVTNGSTAQIGYVVEGLNPNTAYTVRWLIDPAVFLETTVQLNSEIVDDVSKHCVYLNTSYTANEGLGDILVCTTNTSDLLNGAGGYTFTSEADGSICILFLFKNAYASAEQMKEVCNVLEDYVIELSFTRESV